MGDRLNRAEIHTAAVMTEQGARALSEARAFLGEAVKRWAEATLPHVPEDQRRVILRSVGRILGALGEPSDPSQPLVVVLGKSAEADKDGAEVLVLLHQGKAELIHLGPNALRGARQTQDLHLVDAEVALWFDEAAPHHLALACELLRVHRDDVIGALSRLLLQERAEAWERPSKTSDSKSALAESGS